jgi:hypothetical protein
MKPYRPKHQTKNQPMSEVVMTQTLQGKITQLLIIAAAAIILSSCAATSVKQTWKAPDYSGGPVRKLAVLAVEERGMLRQALENRFNNQLKAAGQEAVVTHQLLSLQNIKEDKQAAAERFKEAGADSILIVRLVDMQSHTREVRATSAAFVPVTTGFENYGWYDCYSVAFMDMGTVWGSLKQKVLLETSLFDLTTGKRLWNCLTETTLKEDMDRLEEADALVAKVVAAARKDGLIR